MIQGFFLNGIHTETTGTTVSSEHDLVSLPGAHKAQTLLVLVQFTKTRTEIAL